MPESKYLFCRTPMRQPTAKGTSRRLATGGSSRSPTGPTARCLEWRPHTTTLVKTRSSSLVTTGTGHQSGFGPKSEPGRQRSGDITKFALSRSHSTSMRTLRGRFLVLRPARSAAVDLTLPPKRNQPRGSAELKGGILTERRGPPPPPAPRTRRG